MSSRSYGHVVRENMRAAEEDKLQDEELLAQMS